MLLPFYEVFSLRNRLGKPSLTTVSTRVIRCWFADFRVKNYVGQFLANKPASNEAPMNDSLKLIKENYMLRAEMCFDMDIYS